MKMTQPHINSRSKSIMIFDLSEDLEIELT